MENLVKKRRLRKTPLIFVFVMVFTLVFVGFCDGAEPEKQTYSPWDAYILASFNLQANAVKHLDLLFDYVPKVNENYERVDGEYELIVRGFDDNDIVDAQDYVKAAAAQEFILPAMNRGSIYSNRAAGDMVALTFDDGVFSGMTEAYLEVLEENNATATFFALGKYVERYPEVAQKVVTSGNELACHSWFHADQTTLTEEERLADIALCDEAFVNAVGFVPYLYRVPYGAINDEIRAMLKQQHMVSVLWSIDTLDWKAETAEEVVTAVLDNVKGGDIILMHENKAVTLEALPLIIQGLQAEGYDVVSVSELLYANSDAQLSKDV